MHTPTCIHIRTPLQFFRQEDSTMNDAVSVALLLAVVYCAYKAYAILLGA